MIALLMQFQWNEQISQGMNKCVTEFVWLNE